MHHPPAPATAYPLAQTQRYLIERCLSSALEPGCYHTQFSYHLRVEGLVLPLFFKAVSQVAERHPIMRTAFFAAPDGEVRQRIEAGLALRVGFHDIVALGGDEQQAWLRQFLLADRARPFALLGGTEALVRLHLVKRGSDALQFVLVFHHSIWDGWSLAVLMKEVLAHYQQLRQNPTARLAAARHDYVDFIEDEAQARQSAEAARFWAAHLQQHCEAAPLPPVAGNVEEYRPVQAVLPAALVERLEHRAQALKLPLRTLFVAATVALAHELTPLSATTIGIVSNGRSIRLRHPLTTLGLLWNMAPLCVSMNSGDRRLDAAFLAQVQQGLNDTSNFVFYPLRDILAQRQCRELFQVSFNYIDFGGANILPKDGGITFLESGGFDKFHHPLNVLVGRNPFDRGMSLVFNYDARLLTAAQVHGMLERFIARLDNACH